MLAAMNFFDDRPTGHWDHKFTFAEELGCMPALIGFALFMAVVFTLWQVFFN
jgi:hypothetical protein